MPARMLRMTIKGAHVIHEEITRIAAKKTPREDRERLAATARAILEGLSRAGFNQREGICILGWAKWHLIEEMLDE